MVTVTRKPFLKLIGEDVRLEHIRRLINDIEYWLERARVESGPDSTRCTVCDSRRLAYIIALGGCIRLGKMGMLPSEAGDDSQVTSISVATEYLEMVKKEGTPE